MAKNEKIVLYCDDRVPQTQYAESLLKKYEIPYITIPVGGILPKIKGTGTNYFKFSFDFGCPFEGQKKFESHLKYIKNCLEDRIEH